MTGRTKGAGRGEKIEHRILNAEVLAGITALWSSGLWAFRLGLMVVLKAGYNSWSLRAQNQSAKSFEG